MNRVFAVRGAVQISEDTKEAIFHGVKSLFTELMDRNQFEQQDIISIIISQTEDLVSCNPAFALRTGCGVTSIPLFAVQECKVVNSMPRVVRFMLHVNADSEIELNPVYIHGAEKLRMDLS